MCRTAKYLLGCISPAYPGFRPAKGKLQGNKPKMEKLPPGHTDTVGLDFISNVAFMGITEDGLLMPVLRAGEGSFSTLATAPPPPLPLKKQWKSVLVRNKFWREQNTRMCCWSSKTSTGVFWGRGGQQWS
jgi:hypothetical protein